MSAGSLSTGKDNAYHLLLSLGSISTLLEGNLLLSVCVGEQRFNLLLICNALSLLAFLHADICDTMSQHPRKLGRILVSGFL